MFSDKPLTDHDLEYMEAEIRDCEDEHLHDIYDRLRMMYSFAMSMGIDDKRRDAEIVLNLCEAEINKRIERNEKALLN
jgi:hypothetical protein